jgi:threonine aldolase
MTLPTEEMWRAMRRAELGWAVAREDASVNELEELAADMAGKEASLFVQTGNMGNLVALMTLTSRGDQVLLEASSHILWCEEWNLAYIAGVVPRAIDGIYGHMDPHTVRAAITESKLQHRPRTGLLCLENTHNLAGGTILSPARPRAGFVRSRAGGPGVRRWSANL